MKRYFASPVIVLVAALFAVSAIAQTPATQAPAAKESKRPDVIFVATQQVVVEQMLKLAGTGEKDVVYDLGCGDGRIPITAVQKFGAKRAVGIDIDPERIKESNANAKKAGVTGKVEFRQADLFASDFSEASVVTLYLLSTLNEKLRPILLQQLKPGTRIVSHDFAMGDWQPEQTQKVQGPEREHTIYLWTVPEKKNDAPAGHASH